MHPLVTLLEKLDALSRRYARERLEPDGFCAPLVRGRRPHHPLAVSLPAVEQSPRALADEMFGEKDLLAIPSSDEPALVLDDVTRRTAVEQALARIQGMFWGPCIPLEEACEMIREWIRENLE